MTRDWFDAQVSRLAVLPFPPVDIDGHWEALRDIPPQVLQPAIGHALKTRVRFPVPAELRADCDAVVRQQRPIATHPTSRFVPVEGGIPVTVKNPFGGPDLHVTVTEVVRHDCDDCDDSGNVLYWCGDEPSARWPWLYRRRCDRHNAHADHDWAAPCPCVATNPTIQRRKAHLAAKYSQEPEKVGR